MDVVRGSSQYLTGRCGKGQGHSYRTQTEASPASATEIRYMVILNPAILHMDMHFLFVSDFFVLPELAAFRRYWLRSTVERKERKITFQK